ncbi:hypothetical protein [Paenibacillus sp. J2TS4]|uniref:hypothetical protein n=1 Tax=Paenibacillus sp. J2TS4 TaxID=2807194 RepID=UPI001B02244C|nr:hypothetical protein [Paenibacillus sp. J2TS4]GIP33957.1 hypothetical protein J2TS4_31670 [Paenibacillus sp. J2TS4]
MDSSKGNKPQRQITYQIGWRKGKIEYDPQRKRGSNAKKPGSLLTATASSKNNFKRKRAADDRARRDSHSKQVLTASSANYPALLLTGSSRWLWIELPWLPARAAEVLLWMLPAISFGLIIWVVYSLMHY